jgi:hypothetical protein
VRSLVVALALVTVRGPSDRVSAPRPSIVGGTADAARAPMTPDLVGQPMRLVGFGTRASADPSWACWQGRRLSGMSHSVRSCSPTPVGVGDRSRTLP